MFDVSHMTVVDVIGPDARRWLSGLLANDVARLREEGKALYSCMLNEQGGVIDDLIAYYLTEDHFRLVVNAATREKDLHWMEAQASGERIDITERSDLAMIAVQGPEARAKALAVMEPDAANKARSLNAFFAAQCDSWFVARTGYTGEDGFEITLPSEAAEAVWNRLLAVGVKPCGLGARDTLRLEAGMNLYGQDMDETVSPLESGLAWTVALEGEREFIGREALTAQRAAGTKRRLVGLVLDDRGVLRAGQEVITPQGAGKTTSGGFSPTLQKAIAFARIPQGDATHCEVDIRGKRLPARIVRPPFVRQGKACKGIL